MNTPNEAPPDGITIPATVLPPLTLVRNNPRLAKEGYKSFQGLAADKRTMILDAIKTSLSNPTNDMSKFVGRVKVKKFQQEIQNPDLTMNELQIMLLEVVQMKYVQLTGPPYQIKYHTALLK
jgi:hypothetical protein